MPSMYYAYRRSYTAIDADDDGMALPNRQVNNRRLPPLPGGTKRGNSPHVKHSIGVPSWQHHHQQQQQQQNPRSGLTRPGSLSPKASASNVGAQDMIITGYPLAGNFSKTRFSPTVSESHISSYDLNPDIVATYLQDNPEFLDQYVAKQVPQEQVERWLIKKSGDRTIRSKHENNKHSNDDLSPRSIKESIARWKFTLHDDRRMLLQEMTRDIHQQHNRAQVLCELAACIAAATNAEGFNLYLADERGEDVFYYKPNSECSTKDNSECSRRIGPGSILAAFVAHSKSPLRMHPYRTTENFPEGLGVGSDGINSVLCQPVLQSTGDVAGIIELFRKNSDVPFTEEEEEVSSNLLLFLGDLVMRCHEMYHNMTKQRKLNEFLLTVTKSIFQDIISMDTVIMKIMNYAKKLVNADRTSLFLLDNRTKELYARVFDMGDTETSGNSTPNLQKEIRFPMDKGVAGHVASTGEILNISDAYADERFNRDVDQQTGYKTKTILCMPIYIRGNVIGVVQMVNKLNGLFTKGDEESFETFAIYCGLALHHAKLYEKIRRSEQKYRVALEVLSYHSQASEQEIENLKKMKLPERIPHIVEYTYSPWGVSNDEKPLYVIYMFRDLYSMNRIENNEAESRFDMMTLYRFTLTVRKNYRHVPYHNWEHAFSVAHAMFTIIKTTEHVFTPLECLCLFVACVCHDVDHRGYTNSFLKESSSPLAAIYTTSTMEHHHFNRTITILQNDGHNIFKHLSSDEYKQVLGDIRHCILATDLALFFGNRAKLKDIVDRGNFSWSNKEHKRLAYSIMMTSSDLCASAKPWDIQLDIVKIIFEEFYAQGDEEKRQGNTPIPMMDRDKADELPNSQVGFIVGICLPCYELMAQILPNTQPMVDGARANLARWQELADKQKAAEKEKAAEKGEAEKT